MSDDKTFDPDKLFNDVSKAMQDNDGDNKLSELLAQETPEEEEHLEEELPDEDQPEELDDKATKDSPHEEEEEEEETPDDDSDKAGKPADKKKDKAPEDKTVEELREQLAAAQKEAQALRSQAGRVPSLQRKMAELDKKLEALRAAPSSQTSTKIKPKVDKLLEGIKDTDPVLADTIAQAVAAAIEGVDEEFRTKEEATLNLLREQSQAEYVEEQKSRLLSLYPNAPQVFASPHWAEWKKSQPQHILDLASSSNADAVAMAFDLYAKDMQAKYPDLVKGEDAAGVPDKDTNEEAKRRSEQLEQERQKRKKTAVNLDTSRPSAREKEPTNPDALFNKYFAEIAAEITGK